MVNSARTGSRIAPPIIFLVKRLSPAARLSHPSPVGTQVRDTGEPNLIGPFAGQICAAGGIAAGLFERCADPPEPAEGHPPPLWFRQALGRVGTISSSWAI